MVEITIKTRKLTEEKGKRVQRGQFDTKTETEEKVDRSKTVTRSVAMFVRRTAKRA